MRTKASGIVKSADRVLDLLEFLAARPEGATHAAIAAALAIPKGSLTPLLRNLVARRWLAFRAGPNTYSLGEAALALGPGGAGAAPLAGLLDAAPPILQRLTAATEESSSLNLRRGDEVEVVCWAHSALPLLYAMKRGDLAPLYAVSGGKAILAHLPGEEREAYLSSVRFERITPHTLASAAALRAELDAAAAEGVAYSFEEFTPGIIGMGAAVLDAEGRPVASVNVAIPAVRYGPEKRARVAAALREAGAALAAALPRPPATGRAAASA